MTNERFRDLMPKGACLAWFEDDGQYTMVRIGAASKFAPILRDYITLYCSQDHYASGEKPLDAAEALAKKAGLV